MSRLAENVNRRSVLKAGALVVAFALAGAKVVSARLARDGADGDTATTKAIGGFVRIEADGRIVLVMPSVEMGQGIYTAEAVLLAEELDVGLDQVDLVAAPPDALLYAQPLFKAQMTGGSTSIRGFWTPLRQAGATARAMLVAAAAARWNVPPETCSTDRAIVRHEASGRSLSYSELAGDAAAGPTPANVPLKGAGQWKLIGQSVKRLDTPQKVNGQAVFGIDVVVPGIKIAAVTMCPVDGGRIANLDDAATRRLQGVRDVLRLQDAVAVVADTYWTAKTGLDALLIEWDHGPNAAVSSETMHSAQVQASSSGEPIAGLLSGDVESAFSAAAKRVEAAYELPFLAHATMEPVNTTVHVRPDGCDIWVGTQTPVVAQTHAARIVGLPKDKVRIHNHLIGGGFGRRLQADTIEQAVAFARQVDYPVKFIWTREQVFGTTASGRPISIA
jgi:isoquinoline 1-oxidoreductase beta subunit